LNTTILISSIVARKIPKKIENKNFLLCPNAKVLKNKPNIEFFRRELMIKINNMCFKYYRS